MDENGENLDFLHSIRGLPHGGMFSHGYLVSDTVERLARWEKFRADALAGGHAMFTRGEQDEEWRVCGWSSQKRYPKAP